MFNFFIVLYAILSLDAMISNFEDNIPLKSKKPNFSLNMSVIENYRNNYEEDQSSNRHTQINQQGNQSNRSVQLRQRNYQAPLQKKLNKKEQLIVQNVQAICQSEFLNPSIKFELHEASNKQYPIFVDEFMEQYGVSKDSYYGIGLKQIVDIYWIFRTKGLKEAKKYAEVKNINEILPIITEQVMARRFLYNHKRKISFEKKLQKGIPCILLQENTNSFSHRRQSIFSDPLMPEQQQHLNTLPNLSINTDRNTSQTPRKKTDMRLTDDEGYLSSYGTAYILKHHLPFFADSTIHNTTNNSVCTLALSSGLDIKIIQFIENGSSTQKIYHVQHPNSKNIFIVKCLKADDFDKVTLKGKDVLEREDYLECTRISDLNFSKIVNLPTDRKEYLIIKLAEEVLSYIDSRQRLRFVQILHAGQGERLYDLEQSNLSNLSALFPIFNKTGKILKNFHDFTHSPHGDCSIGNILHNRKNNNVEFIDNETILCSSNLQLDPLNVALCDLVRFYLHEALGRLKNPSFLQSLTILFKQTLDGYMGTDTSLRQQFESALLTIINDLMVINKIDKIAHPLLWEMPFWNTPILFGVRKKMIEMAKNKENTQSLSYLEKCIQQHIVGKPQELNVQKSSAHNTQPVIKFKSFIPNIHERIKTIDHKLIQQRFIMQPQLQQNYSANIPIQLITTNNQK